MCKWTMYKRARIPMFLWERHACTNSGAQAVFPCPRKNGLGTRLLYEQQLIVYKPTAWLPLTGNSLVGLVQSKIPYSPLYMSSGVTLK